MADQRSRVVLEAHALRSATATAVLLHGTRRSARDLKRPFGALIAGAILAVVLLVAVAAATLIGDALEKRRLERERRNALPAAVAIASAAVTAPVPTSGGGKESLLEREPIDHRTTLSSCSGTLGRAGGEG